MRPNVVFLLTDQWRLQSLGYAGNAQVQTPNIDRLASESVNFTHAISGWPLCSPWRASLLTGQYPLTHGVFTNDLPISGDPVGMGEAFERAGYDTAYIGKWHVNGQGRTSYVPPERRLGFNTFKALECTHDYNRSEYYAGNDATKLLWDGYDVFAQAGDAMAYIRERERSDPFMLLLSWGPPHNPYETAPEAFRTLYQPEDIELRPNVPAPWEERAREWIAGYYAHCTAIDKSVGDLLTTLDEIGIGDQTVVVFASDHGDMLGSQGQERKQRPWEESIRVPFLVRLPGREGGEVDAMLNAHDILPTLLGLCGVEIPDTVDGRDFSPTLTGGPDPSGGAALLASFYPLWEAGGGREFRGVRTHRHTYVRTLEGPWLLYDNERDPYQLVNLVNDPAHSQVQEELERTLRHLLTELGDNFERGLSYVQHFGFTTDATGRVLHPRWVDRYPGWVAR
ncbi:MAG: sulfatase [Truepera sp.]|nr:sulfatase [Truepera sp.]